MKQQQLEQTIVQLEKELDTLQDAVNEEFIRLTNLYKEGKIDAQQEVFGKQALIRVVKSAIGEEEGNRWLSQISEYIYWE